MLVKLY